MGGDFDPRAVPQISSQFYAHTAGFRRQPPPHDNRTHRNIYPQNSTTNGGDGGNLPPHQRRTETVNELEVGGVIKASVDGRPDVRPERTAVELERVALTLGCESWWNEALRHDKIGSLGGRPQRC